MNAMVSSKSASEWTLLRLFNAIPDFLIIGALLLLWWLFSNWQHNQRMQIAKAPLVNDFVLVDYYQIDPTSDQRFRYLPLRITQIDKDNISFKYSNYGHDKPVAIDKHVKFDAVMNYNYFNPEVQVVTRKVFSSWVEEGVIYDAARPNTNPNKHLPASV